MKTQLFKTLLFMALPCALTAQATLVEAPATASQDIARVSSAAGKLYFTGREQGGVPTDIYLWSNDGTTSTKIKLMSQVSQNINTSYFYECNGKAYFFYSDGVSASGYEPWVTDGTAAGTFMIKDINPGAGNSVLGNGLQSCFCYNNKIYFGADNGVNGNELWVSDGTAAGTMLVKDIKSGSSSSAISDILLYKNEMYFTARSNNYNELWHSDGTTAGTVKVNNPAGLAKYGSLVLHDTLIYFSGEASNGDFGMWKTNGTTALTSVITGTIPQTPLAGIGAMISNGTDVFFGYQYYSAGYAYRLYKTNGSGITLVKDSMNFKNPYLLGNKIVFKGEVTGSATMGEPWVTDGISTVKLNSISWSTAGTFRNVAPVFNNKLYFAAGNAVWETDGTIAGTMQTAAGTLTTWDFAVLNNELFFNAQNPANSNRQELFKLGTSATGITDHFLETGIQVFPQPAADHITIVFSSAIEAADIQIMDLLGKQVYAESIKESMNTRNIKLEQLNSGIYLLNIRVGNSVQTKKIMVQK